MRRPRNLRMRLAGHPSPLVVGQDDVLDIPPGQRGPLLGVFDDPRWPATEVVLGRGVDAGGVHRRDRRGTRQRRHRALRLDRTRPRRCPGRSDDARRLADALVDAAEEANGQPLVDDVALVILSNPGRHGADRLKAP